MAKWLFCFTALAALNACTFNFDVTSQRTALENQVMGSYKELDDDLILASSVRGAQGVQGPAPVAPGRQKALDARLNQQFNRDDVEELKQKQIVGEQADGTLGLVPNGKRPDADDKRDLHLAEIILGEENRDRRVIWQRIIDANDNLTDADLPNVRKTYAKMQREGVPPGVWYQDDEGRWQLKSPAAGRS